MLGILASRQKDVEALHNSIYHDLQRATVGWSYPISLLDTFLLGSRIQEIPPEKYVPFKQRVLDALAEGARDLPGVNTWGLFNLPAIASLKAAYCVLIDHYDTPYWDDVLVNPDVRPHKLIEMSGRISSPTNLLCLKYFWLYNKFETPYEGVLPHTRPVVRACKFLWRTDFGTALGATMHQQRLAQETGRKYDAMYINSVLWLMGQELGNNLTE